MKIIYIIFFGILNTLIFSFLNNYAKVNSRLKIGFIILLLLITITHFINPYKFSISNDLFLLLFQFSLSLLIFHSFGIILIWIEKKTHSNSRDKNIIKLIEVLSFKAIYVLIFLFQIRTIIKNWN